jgi:hypothetical protein
MWTGGLWDRLWTSATFRQVSEFPGDFRDTPATGELGEAPALGYLARLNLDVAEAQGGIRFGRWLEPSRNQPVSQLNLHLGGQLRALTMPGLAFMPGAWLLLDHEFAEPDAGQAYRRLSTRLFTSATLSSPWIGGDADLLHRIELGSTVQTATFRSTQALGTRLSNLPLVEQAPALAWEAYLDQSLWADGLRLHFPLRWVVQGDESHVFDVSRIHFASELTLASPTVTWDVGQRLRVDPDSMGDPAWVVTTEIAFNEDESWSADEILPNPSVTALSIGAACLLRRPQEALYIERRLAAIPSLPFSSIGRRQDDLVALQVWTSAELGLVGLDASLTWPHEIDGEPLLAATAMFGSARSFRLAVWGARYTNDSWLTGLTITQTDLSRLIP